MARHLNAGRLRNLVTLQNAAEAHAGGEVQQDWQDVDTIWCEVLPATSREFHNAAQVQPEITHVLRTRYRSELALTHRSRLLLGSRVLHLAGPPVDVEETHTVWQLNCIERPTD